MLPFRSGRASLAGCRPRSRTESWTTAGRGVPLQRCGTILLRGWMKKSGEATAEGDGGGAGDASAVERFFERPILNSPYEYPDRHWELDAAGQPTHKILNYRRSASFISPIPQAEAAEDQAGPEGRAGRAGP